MTKAGGGAIGGAQDPWSTRRAVVEGFALVLVRLQEQFLCIVLLKRQQLVLLYNRCRDLRLNHVVCAILSSKMRKIVDRYLTQAM